MSSRIKFCIIGIPDHQGVMYVGGRLGAVKGPAAFRRVLSTFKGKTLLQENIQDRGDVPNLGLDVALNHNNATEFIRLNHPRGGISVVIGGSHDHGFSHLSGISACLSQHGKPVRLGCINIDAHLDVRKPAPFISSGSPFYLALESGVIHPKRLIEFGIQSHCNAAELWKYIESKKVEVVEFQRLRRGRAVPEFQKQIKKLARDADAIVISLDLDSLAAAFAPGVSAPQAEGLSASEVIEMVEIAGRMKKVVSLGIFELNPEHDVENKTARIAATAAYHFFESASKRLKV